MSSEVLTDLTLRIRANSAELVTGLDKAKGNINKFAKKGQETGKTVSKAFASIKDAGAAMAGDLTDKLGGVVGNLGGLASAFPAIVAGFEGAAIGANVFKVALAATGVGLIVVALGALVTYLTKTQDGMDLVSKVTNTLGAVFDAVIERVGFLGQAIVKLMSGDAAGAVESVKKAYVGLGDQIEKNYEDAQSRSDEEVKLREEKISWITKEAELDQKRSELLLRSKEKEKYSERERLKFLQEAGRIQTEISNQNIAFKQRELAIQERIVAQGITTAEDRTKLANLQKEALLIKKAEFDKGKEIASESAGLIAIISKQNQEQNEINETLERRKNILEQIGDVKPAKMGAVELPSFGTIAPPKVGSIETPEAGTIAAPQIAPVNLAPVTQQFADLREALRATGTGFEELGIFSNGLNLLPAIEQTSALKEKLDAMIPTFTSIGGAMTSAFSQFGDVLQSAAVQGGQSLKELTKSAKEAAHGIIRSMIAQGVAALVKGALVSASFLGPVGLALAAPMAAAAGALATSAFSSIIPAFANGGVTPGGMALVGERGPELVTMPKGSRVASNEQSMRMLSQAGGQNVTVHITGSLSGQDILLAVDEAKRRNAINF